MPDKNVRRNDMEVTFPMNRVAATWNWTAEESSLFPVNRNRMIKCRITEVRIYFCDVSECNRVDSCTQLCRSEIQYCILLKKQIVYLLAQSCS